jgi:hypothetical protein
MATEMALEIKKRANVNASQGFPVQGIGGLSRIG